MAKSPIRRGARAPEGEGRTSRLALLGLTGILLTACTGTAPPPDPTHSPSTSPDDRLAALVPAAIRADGRLVVGTDPNYPPMEFAAPDRSTLRGVDIDLIEAVAAVLALEPVFEEEAFTALPEAVRTGRAEVGIAALTIRGRQKTDAVLYFRSATQLVANRRAGGLALDRMCGRRIAVVDGSVQVVALKKTANACRRAGRAPVTIVGRSDQPTITRMTAAGRVDGMLTDAPVAAHAVRTSGGALRIAGPPIRPSVFGIVVAPAYPGLSRAVSGALQHLIESGYYGQVLRRWRVARGAVARVRIRWSEVSERRARQRQRATSRGQGQ